jgi:hypothetical protein
VSARALHPTARMRPVLLERLARQRGAHGWGALVLAGMAVYLRVKSDGVPDQVIIAGVMLVGFVLASAAHEQRPAWDTALPVDPARYALVRLVCGVVWAAFILAVLSGLCAALFKGPEQPAWYPLALFAWGLTCHLLGSVVFLRFMQPAAILACLGALGAVVLPGSSVNPAELRRVGVWAVLAWTALPLALAGAAAYAATRFYGHAPQPADPTVPLPRAPQRDAVPAIPDRSAAPAERPARPGVRRGGLHRPPGTRTVFWRHFALLRPFTVLPAATLMLFVVILGVIMAVAREEGEAATVLYLVESTGLRWWGVWLALSWTVLVWLREHGAQRRWNDTLPVGTGERRVLHAAAGAAWLLLFLAVLVIAPLGAAVAAGTLASPTDVPASLWLGLPCRALTLYLAATLVFFGTRLAAQISPSVAHVLVALKVDRVVPLMIILMSIGIIAVPYGVYLLGVNLLETQARVAGQDAGSGAAAALWLVLYAAATAATIALNDWIHHRDRLPSIREVRGFLHGWAGTRPGASLRGHAGR